MAVILEPMWKFAMDLQEWSDWAWVRRPSGTESGEGDVQGGGPRPSARRRRR